MSTPQWMADEFRAIMKSLQVTPEQKALITRALELQGRMHRLSGAESMRERAAKASTVFGAKTIRALPLDESEGT